MKIAARTTGAGPAQLDLLPTRHAGAAENMAVDFLLLKRHPAPARARFRHYGWHRPAFTFGYSQKIDFVRAQLPPDETVELCRRPTGGGVVDHRADWTYALVIPRAHALCEAPASESYRVVHACIAGALLALGQPVALKESGAPGGGIENTDTAGAPRGGRAAAAGGAPAAGIGKTDTAAGTPPPRGPGVCFAQPELHDVVRADNAAKVAGAAQKRSRDGLLFQGSIARDALDAGLDWDAFHAAFTAALARALGTDAAEAPWPDFAEHELDGLVEHYTAPEWNEFR
jgi:lipoate-protein ligase A